MTKSYALPVLSTSAGFAQYLVAISKVPMLTLEEEQELTKEYVETGSQKAGERLIMSHLRLAAKTAFSFRHYGLPIVDLVSEANLGLMQAVKKFDPSKGYRLSTYAIWWIKAALHDYILKSWSLVKMGTMATQKRLFYNLKKIKAKLGIYNERSLSTDQAKMIASELDVNPSDVIDMEARLQGDYSLNVTLGEDGKTESQDLLVDEKPTAETILLAKEEKDIGNAALKSAMAVLNDRERTIFVRRHLKDDPDTLEVLSQDFGVSRERIRQIEEKAYKKVKESLLASRPMDRAGATAY